MILRNIFADLAEAFGDDFRNSKIIVREGNNRKLAYKGAAIKTPAELLDREVLVQSNELGKALYVVK